MAYTWLEARDACRNPQCVEPHARFVIVQIPSREVIEGHFNKERAELSMRWLHEHEHRCGRKTEYVVEPLTLERACP